METLPKILVCDDEPLITESIRELLTAGNNYQIHTTNSSHHALELIRDTTPDLVILDVMMPEMTGFEMLDAVSNDMAGTSYIFVTGESSIDSAIEAIQKGASDYLKKPFEPEELRIRVANVLRQRRIRQEKYSMEAEKKLLESQLRHAQKMEAIGTLAGGIAHDFNNVLSIILGNSELALQQLPRNHDAYPHLDQIHTASLRAREMIKQLLNFSRKDEADMVPLALNRVIDDSLKLIRASLPTNITIERDISGEDCVMIADATQIHQIIFNLCINSAHSMEARGGILCIRLKPAILNSTTAEDLGIAPGNYLHLVVADTGRGIKSDVIDRIFDPYFTTKETGKGTGMGLAVVHGIVKRCGGAIRASSVPDRSTEFHLYFPASDATIAREQSVVDRRKLPRGTERILLVDDEIMLVRMLQRILEQLGYEVTAFVNSRSALEALTERPHDFDLIITDMTMPDMTGLELIRAANRVRNHFPAILCTGYNKQVSQESAGALGIRYLLTKPVSIEDLAKTVRKVLTPDSSDRRRHPRFCAPDGTYVACDARPTLHFNMLDIGVSGMSFSHDRLQEPDSGAFELSIITADGNCIVSGLKCRLVTDMPDDRPDSPGMRSGVCFQHLSSHQRDQIEHFISNHATQILH